MSAMNITAGRLFHGSLQDSLLFVQRELSQRLSPGEPLSPRKAPLPLLHSQRQQAAPLFGQPQAASRRLFRKQGHGAAQPLFPGRENRHRPLRRGATPQEVQS